MTRLRCATTVLALLLSPALPALAQVEWRFEDVARARGVDFIGIAGTPPRDDLSEVNGSGIAVEDVDGDGRMDMYVVQGATAAGARGKGNRLYLNRGHTFEEAAASWGIDDDGRGAGAVFCDLDGDRRPELLLTNFGPDRAFRHAGDRFEPIEGFDDDGMGMGIGVADYDGDGWGDVFVARYVVWPEVVPTRGGPCNWKGVPVICGPEAYRPMGDVFFRGLEGGRLRRDATPLPTAHRPGRGMGVAVTDLDGDARPDLYVANDATDNFFYRWSAGGWSEDALAWGCALSFDGRPEAGMGVGPGDLDGDGREDVVVTNFDGQTHAVYVNAGDWMLESSRRSGIAGPSLRRLSWGVHAADFDNDGDLDLFVANGHLYDNAETIGDDTHWRQPDDLFVNDGRGNFRPLDEGWDGVEAGASRGSAVVDLDDDGRLDLIVWGLGDPLRILHNRSEGTGRWLRVRLQPAPGEPEATICGSRVELFAGESRWVRWFRRGSGYLGCDDPRLHFGLGAVVAVDSLRVSWAHGGTTILPAPALGVTHEVVRRR